MGWLAILPVLLVLLTIPDLRMGYFWDDFYFLHTSGPGSWLKHLMPEAGAPFYRPIPLGLYFGFLRVIESANGWLGHAINLAVLIASVLLLARLVARLAGPRAGLYAGLILAGFAPLTALTAWVSCAQDLFAIFFVVLALRFRHEGRDVAALLCAAAALLSKETAIAAFPLLVLWDRVLGRDAPRERFHWFAYGAVALTWAAAHPGIRLLAGHGFRSGATSYVGLEHSERWALYVGRYLQTLFNLTPSGLTSPWWPERAPFGIVALAVLIAGLVALTRRRAPARESANAVPLARFAAMAGLLVVPALLMPALLVRHWAPYFACLPAVGVAMLAGAALAKSPRMLAPLLIALFFVQGAKVRGVRASGEWVLGERAMAEASEAAGTARANLRELFPSIPARTQVVASVGTGGITGMQSALFDGQAVGLWYGDPSVTTVAPLQRAAGRHEILVRVTPALDVIAIDPDSLHMRTTGPSPPPLEEYDRLVSNYARAVAAQGETDRAIAIMGRLRSLEPGEVEPYNRRLVASMLLAANRRPEAERILAATDSFPSEVAFLLVWRLLAEASPSESLDTAAFEAFGLDAHDPQTLRSVMRQFRTQRSPAQAAWYAGKLAELLPGDGESQIILSRAKRAGITPTREATRRVAAAGEGRAGPTGE